MKIVTGDASLQSIPIFYSYAQQVQLYSAASLGDPAPSLQREIYPGGFTGIHFHAYGRDAAGATLFLTWGPGKGVMLTPGGSYQNAPDPDTGLPKRVNDAVFASLNLANGPYLKDAQDVTWRVCFFEDGETISPGYGPARAPKTMLMQLREFTLPLTPTYQQITLNVNSEHVKTEIQNNGPNKILIAQLSGFGYRQIPSGGTMDLGNFGGSFYATATVAAQVAGAATVLTEIAIQYPMLPP